MNSATRFRIKGIGLLIATLTLIACGASSGSGGVSFTGLRASSASGIYQVPTNPGATVVGALGFVDVQGMAYDSNSNTLYGVDNDTDQLLTINSTTGVGAAVGALGFSSVNSLAYDSNSNTLYGVDSIAGQLIVIDTTSGAGTATRGTLGFTNVLGLAFDSNSSTLYGTNIDTDQLIVITANGVGTAVGAFGALNFADVEGLAFDPNSNTLYGTDINTNQLVTIDTASGVGTAAGATYLSLPGLAFLY